MTVKSVEGDEADLDWFDKSEKHHTQRFKLVELQVVTDSMQINWDRWSSQELETLEALISKALGERQ